MVGQKANFFLVFLLHRDIPKNQQDMLFIFNPYIISIYEQGEPFVVVKKLSFITLNLLTGLYPSFYFLVQQIEKGKGFEVL
ncbi:hypothetical protein D3C74_253470 [compost metagenome]